MPERRQVPRYLTETRGQLTQSASPDVISVTVVTISVQGCCVKGMGLPNVGSVCLLTIPWQGRQIRVHAKIAWKQPSGQAGLRFESVDQESADNLRGLCTTLRIQPLSPMSFDD
jgi:hypothetical protein